MIVKFLIQLMEPVVAGIQSILDFIWPSAGVYGVDANLVLGFTMPVLALIPFVLIAAPLERIRPIENHGSQRRALPFVPSGCSWRSWRRLGSFSRSSSSSSLDVQ